MKPWASFGRYYFNTSTRTMSITDSEALKDQGSYAHHETVHDDHTHVVHEANKAVLAQAVAAEDQEHMDTWQALKTFPMATFWSFMVSFVIVCLLVPPSQLVLTLLQIMEAYDNALIGNLMAQPAFQKRYGQQLPDGTYQVPTAWQSACNYASTIGAFIGILICGYIQPKFGYKKCLLGSLVIIVGFIFIPFFAESLPMLFAGQLLIGLPFGFYNAM